MGHQELSSNRGLFVFWDSSELVHDRPIVRPRHRQVQLLNTQASASSLLSRPNRLVRWVGTATEVMAVGLTETPPHPEFADDGWRVEADFIRALGVAP
jgi:hypothetical protein